MRCAKLIAAALLGVSFLAPASAEMVLSQVIFDLRPGEAPRQDVEVYNNGSERMYVAADVFRILEPGTPREQRVAEQPAQEPDLLVSPKRMILAPGERRTVRIAALGPRSETDRIYRVAIKPVAGEVTSDKSALNVFWGYDTLVIIRPEKTIDDIRFERDGRRLVIRNAGNTNQEFFEGMQCDKDGLNCHSLPPKRLYPGAAWEQFVPLDTKVTYKTALGATVRVREF